MGRMVEPGQAGQCRTGQDGGIETERTGTDGKGLDGTG